MPNDSIHIHIMNKPSFIIPTIHCHVRSIPFSLLFPKFSTSTPRYFLAHFQLWSLPEIYITAHVMSRNITTSQNILHVAEMDEIS